MMTRRPHRGTELRRLRAVRADIRVHRDPHPRLRIRVNASAGAGRMTAQAGLLLSWPPVSSDGRLLSLLGPPTVAENGAAAIAQQESSRAPRSHECFARKGIASSGMRGAIAMATKRNSAAARC